MGLKQYLNHAKRVVSKKPDYPLYLIFFITETCHANCGHCLLGGVEDSPLRPDELQLDEIEKISKSMGPLLFLLLTGGDPFIRDDFADIVEIFYRNNDLAQLGVPCNGMYPKKVIRSMRRVLENCPGLDVGLDISIDGIGDDHDTVRGTPGLWKKLNQTFAGLAELRKEFPKFNLNSAITISGNNQHKLEELHEHLLQHFDIDAINNMLVRGKPKQDSALEVDLENYANLNRRLEEDIYQKRLGGYQHFPFADFINAMKIRRNHLIERTVATGQAQLPCTAGNIGGIMYSQGDIYPCELLPQFKLGNVRETGYDFGEVWFSEKAQQVRDHIEQTKCFCTFECFMTNNILFNPTQMPGVLWEYGKIKLARMKRPGGEATPETAAQ